MKLCVGAASRRVVEEAAKLQVAQIVASRRQVDSGGGYTGFDQEKLVETVAKLSDGQTRVIRDHGGPKQGAVEDDGLESFDADVAAGFHALHLDVCKLPRHAQMLALQDLIDRYGEYVAIEIGGERDDWTWTQILLDTVLCASVTPTVCVVDVGGWAYADRQRGNFLTQPQIIERTNVLKGYNVQSKAHNMDWVGNRVSRFGPYLDYYNIAPEFGALEVDAWLYTVSHAAAVVLLNMGYDSRKWERWFMLNEGTKLERAKCGLRYLLETDQVKKILEHYDDKYVRAVISDAIAAG